MNAGLNQALINTGKLKFLTMSATSSQQKRTLLATIKGNRIASRRKAGDHVTLEPANRINRITARPSARHPIRCNQLDSSS